MSAPELRGATGVRTRDRHGRPVSLGVLFSAQRTRLDGKLERSVVRIVEARGRFCTADAYDVRTIGTSGGIDETAQPDVWRVPESNPLVW